MTRSSPITVIELDGAGMAAVRGRVRDGRLVIDRAIRLDRPPVRTDGEDDGWVADALRQAGFPRVRAVLAVPRSAVVFKVLSMPGEGLLEEERIEMAALQIGRQLTIPPDETAIDSFEIGTPGDRRAVCAACPRALLESASERLGKGGIAVAHADLRAAGVAALAPTEAPGPIIAVAPGVHSTEIVVIAAGKPEFARSIDATAAMGDAEQNALDRIAARVAVEVKRTLMSARSAGIVPAPGHVLVIGDDELAERVRAACELELGLPGAGDPAEIAWPADLSREDRRVLAPLAGVIRRHALGIDGIDFVRPHRAPDRGARKRQLTLAALFLVITLVGVGILAARVRLDRLDQRIEQVSDRYDDKYDELVEMKALDARVTHAERWIDADADWLEHGAWIAEVMPGPDRAVLDEMSGRGGAQIRFAKGPRVYPGTWSTTESATIRVSGRMKDRATGLELRRRLLEDTRYRVLTQGPDVEDRFSFDLITTELEEAKP